MLSTTPGAAATMTTAGFEDVVVTLVDAGIILCLLPGNTFWRGTRCGYDLQLRQPLRQCIGYAAATDRGDTRRLAISPTAAINCLPGGRQKPEFQKPGVQVRSVDSNGTIKSAGTAPLAHGAACDRRCRIHTAPRRKSWDCEDKVDTLEECLSTAGGNGRAKRSSTYTESLNIALRLWPGQRL